ncbi:MAG: NAD(P)-dependent oxidoreductase [Deltaproteobacteria bacterium]|nr:NAD(P)-dependent oxidoreductase [Deltaproteobacteria bacterium]
MAHVAVLGTGLIGAGFVHNLVGRGHEVVVWNRTRSKAESLGGARVCVADTVAEAVRGATRVHLALTDDAAVDSVLAAVVDHLGPGALVADHTTTLPKTTGERTARLLGQGVRFVHAPIFMSPTNAKNGTGLMLVGGRADLLEQALPALQTMTGEVWNVGEDPVLPAFYKLCGNAMILTMGGALADILRMAEASGLPREAALGVFAKFQPQGIIQFRGPKMARREFSTSFALEVARKDLRLMQQTAAQDGTGAALAVLDGLAARMDQLIAQGMGNDDIGALAK